MKRGVVRRESCILGDPNCTTYYYEDGTVECHMFIAPEPQDTKVVWHSNDSSRRTIVRGSRAQESSGLVVIQTLSPTGEWTDVPKQHTYQ